MIVYGQPVGDDGYGGTLQRQFACLRPAGKPIAVAQSAPSGGEYPANETWSNLRIDGTFVADASASGFADESACFKYNGSNCEQSVRRWVTVADARTRRRLYASAGGPIGAVAVASAGAVAWLEAASSPASILHAIVLHHGAPGRLSGTLLTLDTGAIGPLLQFKALTLRWTNAGRDRSQTLR